MSIVIKKLERESFPSTRLIGKKYSSGPDWAQWWSEDWFSVLEQAERSPVNGDAFIGGVHIVDGMLEYWVGMLFPAETAVPDGFEYADIEPLECVVCYLYGKEGDSGFYTMDTHNMCLDALRARGLKRKEDDWCFERYNCPRFTTPDERGNVILDYIISLEP